MAYGGHEADDASFSLDFATYLDSNTFEYHEINSNEVPSTGIFHEMANMAPPVSNFGGESSVQADNTNAETATEPKTSRHKILTNSDVDNVQNESIRPRTRKQTEWGVKVFKGTCKKCSKCC